jgi:hypothetical protein
MRLLPRSWGRSDTLQFVAAFVITVALAGVYIVVVNSRLPAGGTSSSSDGSPSPAASIPSPSVVPASPSPATQSAPPEETPAPSATQVAGSLQPDTVAVTVTDNLRVRSSPEVSDESVKFEPLLAEGTELFVLSGPVPGSGYDWYEVAPLSARGFERQTGWVAAAGKDGEVWVAPGVATCPAIPPDFASLAALSIGQRLACFGGVPITLRARLVPCGGGYEDVPGIVTWQCDVDYAVFDPAWFGYPQPVPLLLADPADPGPIGEFEDWHVLHLDPAATFPSPLPVGSVVTVTGAFDHPAARGCQVSGVDQPWGPTDACRLAFAVTAIE